MKAVRTAMMVMAATISLCACSPKSSIGTTTSAQSCQAYQDVSKAVVAASNYTAAEIEVTANEHHIAVSLTRPSAEAVDLRKMETEASLIAAGLEKMLLSKPEPSTVQVLSIAYVHQHGSGETHADDVFEFRKTPGGRFEHHAT